MTNMTKKEIFGVELKVYLKANKGERGSILDTLERQTGMHRKSICRRFRREQLRRNNDCHKVGRKTYYTPDTTTALHEIWIACGELCGELVHPIINDYVDILIRDNMWKHSDLTTGKLRKMSESTVKRKVSKFMWKRSGKGKSTTNPSSIKKRIPVFCGPHGEMLRQDMDKLIQ